MGEFSTPIDPAEVAKRYREQKFTIDVQGIGPAISNAQLGSVALNDRVFILQKITHAIVRWTDWDAHPIGWGVAAFPQDGMYRLDWSINNQQRFWKGILPPLALTAYGSAQNGIWIPFSAPVALSGNETINLNVINAIARTAAQTYDVQVVFHGIERMD